MHQAQCLFSLVNPKTPSGVFYMSRWPAYYDLYMIFHIGMTPKNTATWSIIDSVARRGDHAG